MKPFSLDLEIEDSIRMINGWLPAGKRVELLQWSGDTTPSEKAVAATRKAGVRNLNGGDTRFDPEFNSYGWVAPLSRQVGSERQVYASNSNENTYTGLWTDRFFGFQYLVDTIKNTDNPIRLKPHNIYFHMYSGEKLPSLLALERNYRYAQEQELAPITASAYAAVVDGFHSARITLLDSNRWRIEDRDALQTIRFAGVNSTLFVDYSRSTGVLGQRMHQEDLYVALDPEDPEPVIALSPVPAPGPYLIQARWSISGFRADGETFIFSAHGFGTGEMEWKVGPERTFLFEVRMKDGTVWQNRKTSDVAGSLFLNLGPRTTDPVQVLVTPFPES